MPTQTLWNTDANGKHLTTDGQANEDEGKKWANVTNIGIGIIAVGGVVAAIGVYKVFISPSKSSSEHAARGRRARKDRTFVVTPVLSPSGAGATLRLEW
jgi:hypothetical protein